MDPSDLLIFKKRGANAAKDGIGLQPPPKLQHEELMTGRQPSIIFPKGLPVIKQRSVAQPQQEKAPQVSTQPQVQAPSPAETSAAAAAVYQAKQPVVAKAMYSDGENEEVVATKAAAQTAVQAPAVQAPQGQQIEEALHPDEAKKVSRSGRENIKAAAGHTCVYHPWRPAYAACAYCHRTFCYADIVKHNGNFYCLEDISQVSSTATATKTRRASNTVAKIAAVVFLITIAIFAYYTYPSVSPMIKHMQTVGYREFVISLTPAAQYFFPFVDTVAMGLLFTGAIAIASNSRKGYYWGVLVTIAVLAIAGYGYLYSNLSFMLYISVASILNLALMAYSRIGAVVSAAEEENTAPSDIAWPLTETF